MNQAFLDCFSGISGNMLMGALIDAGWPESELTELPGRLGLQGVSIAVREVKKHSLRAVHVMVSATARPLRRLSDIKEIILHSDLEAEIQTRILNVFQKLAEAEAKVHGCRVEDVHFHEIGAADTIIDIAGSLIGLRHLGIHRLRCSRIPVAEGWVESAHGRLPLPAPAAAELLRGIPVYGTSGHIELVTPTGAALVRTLVDDFGMLQEMRVKAVGYGAGSADIPDRPNLLRLWLGSWADAETVEEITELRTRIDDMNPELYDYLMEQLFRAGAVDVALFPIHMKKNRPGTEISVLAPDAREKELCRIIFNESSTAGIRIYRCARRVLSRKSGCIPTPWGRIGVKLLKRPDGRHVLAPEYEECRRIAAKFQIPVSSVYRAVSRAEPADFSERE
ncbi:MAG TPA: nickel pincer cofactor biosynthesis protein LarC [Thermodesulfobacteriaceae bacterium]|nr:nickel pincer cofactor biosynthesis protein LarC [Thermodesulfobacteriaceae bacterium]